MFRTRGKKIMGDVWSRNGRTALVSAAIFVGVVGTIALFTMSDVLIRQLKKDIDENKLAMAKVSVTVNPGVPLHNADYLHTLSESAGVTAVAGGLESQTVYFKPQETDAEFEEGQLQAYAVDNAAGELVSVFGSDAPIEPLRLEAGAFPRAGANEVVVEQRLADDYAFNVGDPIFFRVLSPSRVPERDQATGTVEQWTISGLVFDAYAGQDNPRQEIFARIEDASYLAGLTGFTDFWFRFVDFPTAERQIGSVVKHIAQDVSYTPIGTITEDPAKSQLLEGARITGSLMRTLALTALVVSGFLVVNVISAIVIEQKRQIGVMKALGASRLDTTLIYSGIALVYGILGVVPGVILGAFRAGTRRRRGWPLKINIHLHGFQISPTSIVLGIVVGLLVPVLASLLPVLNGTRAKILDAMTDLGIDARYHGGPLARAMRILPVPSAVRQGMNNVLLKTVRLVFTLVTLAVAVGAFMGIFSIFSQLTQALDLLKRNYSAQIGLMPLETRDPADIQQILTADFSNDITSIEPGYLIAVEFEGYKPVALAGSTGEIYAYGYDTNSAHPPFEYTLTNGDALTPETQATGLILSSKLADAMKKSVGDVVELKIPGRAQSFDVVGIADYPFDQVWMNWQTLAAMSNPGSTSGRQQPQSYFLTTRETRPTVRQVASLISRISDRFANAGVPMLTTNYVQVVSDTTQTYTSFQVIFQMVALLIALVGALGLLITLSMSVFERQKEIGVMRSVGASSSAVAAQFVTEGILVGVLAWAVGLPVMFGVEALLIQVTGFEGVLTARLTPAAMVIGLMGVIILTFIASLMPALSAARKTVSDILHYG